MAWKVKKEYQGMKVPNFNIPLDEMSQKQIKNIKEKIRNNYFEQETKSSKKKTKVDSNPFDEYTD